MFAAVRHRDSSRQADERWIITWARASLRGRSGKAYKEPSLLLETLSLANPFDDVFYVWESSMEQKIDSRAQTESYSRGFRRG